MTRSKHVSYLPLVGYQSLTLRNLVVEGEKRRGCIVVHVADGEPASYPVQVKGAATYALIPIFQSPTGKNVANDQALTSRAF